MEVRPMLAHGNSSTLKVATALHYKWNIRVIFLTLCLTCAVTIGPIPQKTLLLECKKTIMDVKYLGPCLKEKTSSTCSHNHVKLASAIKLAKLFQTDLISFAWNCMMKMVWEMCGTIWTIHFCPVKDCKSRPEKENCTKGYSFSFQKT